MLVEDLARRVMQADGEFYADCAAAFAELTGTANCHAVVGDTQALFAGEDSPLTQAGGAFAETEIDALTSFYRGRAAWYEAVVTPYADDDAAKRLIDRGANAMGWEDLLWRKPAAAPTDLEIREVTAECLSEWEAVGRRAFWGENPPPFAIQLGELMIRIPDTTRYVALVDGKMAASATMSIRSRIAFFGGGATLPEYRGQGLQTALIQHRLSEAVGLADVAMLGAKPGSPSHRNAERAGFQVAWSQLSLRVPVPRL